MGRERLRSGKDLSTRSHGFVEAVRRIRSRHPLFQVALEHWLGWDRQQGQGGWSGGKRNRRYVGGGRTGGVEGPLIVW